MAIETTTEGTGNGATSTGNTSSVTFPVIDHNHSLFLRHTDTPGRTVYRSVRFDLEVNRFDLLGLEPLKVKRFRVGKMKEKSQVFGEKGWGVALASVPQLGLLKFLVWRSAPCRAPRTPSFPILFTLSHACSLVLYLCFLVVSNTQRYVEQSPGKSSFVLFSSLNCGLAFQLAYSYIQCTDASWSASYDDADIGTQGQHPARR
ncbi:hypothetical protein MTR67_022152 [Solanum verrucosum]|uniref:Uncharacterized protein n=1 Tax=Solanum verrucosum TaxID=315347 RepID=A0AAF0QRC0_SOLVR|nr:hypothetical protein MTR67_022152 [Solanum verrucosum]